MLNKIMLICFCVLAAFSGVRADFSLTTFLQCQEPEKMDQYFINGAYGEEIITFVNPRGGACLRLHDGPTQDYCVSIFCDPSLNGLVSFHFYDQNGVRSPKKITRYGLEPPLGIEVDSFSIHYIDTLTPPANFTSSFTPRDSIGEFYQPVDVAIGSVGGYYNPEYDFVYVVDQGNHRIVKLRHDPSMDSLVWVGTFGEDVLIYPTAVAYADYGSPDRIDHDIYVTDAGQAKFFRFSASGVYESDYGGFGTMISRLGYPTGIATIPAINHRTAIYVSDSHNHCIMRYSSETTGEIAAQRRYIVPFDTYPFLAAVDVDSWGDVYVVDSYNHKIIVLNNEIDTILAEYGSQGTDYGQFESPCDIYINKKGDLNEMVICEWWAEFSGIQCYLVDNSFGKKTTQIASLPIKFELYQNYPNPFNSTTLIYFDIPTPSRVTLDIYNILGQRVVRLADKPYQAGHHQVSWNASGIASGIYFCKLSAGEKTSTQKMLLLK